MSISFDPDHFSQALLRIYTSSIPVPSKLDQILQAISDAFQSDRCLLLRPGTIGNGGFVSRSLAEKKPWWVEDGSSFDRGGVLPQEIDLIQPSFVCLPLCDDISSHGLLYLGFSKKRTFSPAEVDLATLASKVLVNVIGNDLLHARTDDALSETQALHELGKVMASTLKLNDLLESILLTGSKILKARGGVLRLEDRVTGELKVRSSLGGYDQNPFDERLSKQVLFTQTPLVLNRFNEEHPFLSALSAPLIFNRKSIGTLTFYDKETAPSRFDARDFQLLVTTANQISSSIENALIHHETSEKAREQENRARQLATLWELNEALLTTMDFDRLLHTALTLITQGEGLRFNRAMLFLVNEKKQLLEGVMAVGPDSPEEAGVVWDALSRKKGGPLDLINQIPSSPPETSILNSTIRQIRIPLEQKDCFLIRTALEGKAVNVQFPKLQEECRLSSSSGCAIGKRLGRDPGAYAFAAVPILGKGNVMGVILVDNIYNQQPITEDDIEFLSMFSNEAGLAIENATLYRHLEEVHRELKEAQDLLLHREKMVALGEMCSTISHEIKNPLVSIGGFARRLYRSVPAEAPERRYSQTIIVEVARLERILSDIMQYTDDDSVSLGEHDLREIIEDSLSMVSDGFVNGARLVKEYAEDLPGVRGDYQQLKQAFFNLIMNAHQAIKGKGTVAVRVYPLQKEKEHPSCVRVEVEDNGAGINPEHLHHIFNPFYSTKESGPGLGLATVHKVVTSLGGQIEVDNRPGKGVKFIITLPVRKEDVEKCRDFPLAGRPDSPKA